MKSQLPRYLDVFFGREQELHTLGFALQHHRLVTVVGFGGVGKTRLAVECCRRHLQDFPDGMVFFDAYPSRDLQHFIFQLGRRFGMDGSTPENLLENLTDHLQGMKLLLIFDNTEHLAGMAGLIRTLLHSTDTLKVMVTSRERLRLRGEFVCPVYPFHVDEDQDHWDTSEALHLLINRAVMAGAHLQPSDQPGLLQLCRLLEGIPLCMELVAVHLAHHPPEKVVELLEQDLLLHDALYALDLDDRQQNLHNLMDWSYRLLSSTEQLAFRALGLFDAKMDWKAAEALLEGVFRDQGCNSSPQEVLFSLLDKHLLCHKIGADGHSQVFLLDVARQFARQKMQDNERQQLLLACLEWHLTRLDEQKQAPMDTQLQHFSRHAPHLHQLIEPLLATHPIRCAALIARIWQFWQASRDCYLGLRYTGALYQTYLRLDPAEARELSLHLVSTLVGAGWISNDNLDFEQSKHHFTLALQVAGAHQRPQGEASALQGLAHLSMMWGKLELAELYTRKAAEVLQQQGTPSQKLWITTHQARLRFLRGDAEGARGLFEGAQQGFLQENNLWGAAWTHLHLAEFHYECNHPERALEHLQALQGFPLPDLPTVVMHQQLLYAKVCLTAHQPEQAAHHLQQCLSTSTRPRTHRSIAEVLHLHVLLLLQQGKLPEAEQQLERILQPSPAPVTVYCLLNLHLCGASLAHARGNLQESRLLLQKCQDLHQSSGIWISPRRKVAYDQLQGLQVRGSEETLPG